MLECLKISQHFRSLYFPEHFSMEFSKSLLNCVGCVVTWVTWVRGLRGSVGAWVAWVKFLRGLRGLRGSKYFLRSSTFFVWVKNFLRGSKFLRGSIYFVVGLKNIDWRFHNNILVFYYIRIENTLNQHPISCNFSFTWFWSQFFAYFFHLHYA